MQAFINQKLALFAFSASGNIKTKDGRDFSISFSNQLSRSFEIEINNGYELFGAQSGHGFNELAAYDQDNNGWIDEADDIFSELKLWFKNEDQQQLTSLLASGIALKESTGSPVAI